MQTLFLYSALGDSEASFIPDHFQDKWLGEPWGALAPNKDLLRRTSTASLATPPRSAYDYVI
jgi:hypothetical protein